MESNHEYVFNKLREEIEEKVNKIPVDKELITLNDDLSDVVNKLDLKSFENSLYNKYQSVLQLLNENSVEAKEQDSWTPNLDFDNPDFPTGSFSTLSNKEKIEALNTLISTYIIDTKQENWPELSQILIQCFISSSNEVFLCSLKIIYRLISLPSTAGDGYVTLLTGAITLFTNKLNANTIISDVKFVERVSKILNILLHTLEFTLKNTYHARDRTIEEVMILFVSLLNQEFRAEDFPSRTLTLIDLVAHLDAKAKWFMLFSVTSSVRETCMKIIVERKVLKLLVNLYYCLTKPGNYNSKTDLNIFTHCCYCLMYVLEYSSNLKFFPVSVKNSDKVNYFDLIENMISRIKDSHVTAEVKDVLKDIVPNIFSHNPNILNSKVLTQLIEPFRYYDKKCPITILENNFYVLNIIIDIIKKDRHVLFVNMNKFHKPKLKRFKIHSGCISFRVHINHPQIIIDFTIAYLKKLLNDSNSLKPSTFKLLQCCHCIFQCNSVSFYYVNSKKIIMSLTKNYESLAQESKVSYEIIQLFMCFFKNDTHTFEVIENELLITEIFNKILKTGSWPHLIGFICNIANHAIGYNFIKNNHNLIVKNKLESLWHINENEEYYTQENNNMFDYELKSFLHFIFVLSCNTKALMALLLFENEDTIVGTEGKAVILGEVIERCFESSEDSVEDQVGLSLIRVLSCNIDVLVYLETNFKLQEKFSALQNECKSAESPADNQEIIVDTCSLLRHNILKSLKYIGFISHNSNSSSLEQKKVVIDGSESQPSSALRKREKSPNELQKFINTDSSGMHDQSWLIQARRAFKLTCNESYKVSVIADLLELVPKTFVYRKTTLSWPPQDSVYHQLFPEDLTGTSLIVDYGIKLALLDPEDKNEDNLNLLIKQSRTYLSHYPEEFESYDWFIGMFFLICSGNLEKCQNFLVNITNTNVTWLVWYTFGKEFDFIFQDNFYLQLRIIIEENNPVVYSALEELGIPLTSLVQKWLNECFFNILEFEEICNFLVFTVLFPPESTIFFILAIFEHIKTSVCKTTYSKSIEDFLQISQFGTFRLTNYLPFIEKYLKQYRNIIKL